MLCVYAFLTVKYIIFIIKNKTYFLIYDMATGLLACRPIKSVRFATGAWLVSGSRFNVLGTESKRSPRTAERRSCRSRCLFSIEWFHITLGMPLAIVTAKMSQVLFAQYDSVQRCLLSTCTLPHDSETYSNLRT